MEKPKTKRRVSKKSSYKFKDFVDFFEKHARHCGVSYGSKEYILFERIFVLARLKEGEEIPRFSTNNDYNV